MVIFDKTDLGVVVHAKGDLETILWELALGTAQIHLHDMKDTSDEGIKAAAQSYSELLTHLMILMKSPEGQKHIKDMSFKVSDVLSKDVN